MNHFVKMSGLALAVLLAACNQQEEKKSAQPAASAAAVASQPQQTLLQQAQGIFQPLPTFEESRKAHPFTDAQVALGKQLWYDTRLSVANDISCNSCHGLDTFGVDNKQTSSGHKGALGVRNSPTAYNAFLHTMQFWDGRSPHVEHQATQPIINPVEMAMPDHATVEKKIAAIEGYAAQFKELYADKGGQVNIDNIGHAIGAFERTLLTPSRWDKYLQGDVHALNEQEQRGVKAFIDHACVACHSGVSLGGDMVQKFGLIKGPYWQYIKSDKHDEGVFEVSKKEEDKFFFKVPGLRNVAKTAPYFHNGSVSDLHEAVRIMGETQLGKSLPKQDIDDIVAFLNATTGELPADALVKPELPK